MEILALGEDEARVSTTRRKMSYLYESWMSSGENWKKSTVWVNIQSKSGTIRKGVKCWMTRNQITQRYGKELMEDICAYKLSSDDLKEKETRYHPDAPNVEARRLLENSTLNFRYYLRGSQFTLCRTLMRQKITWPNSI